MTTEWQTFLDTQSFFSLGPDALIKDPWMLALEQYGIISIEGQDAKTFLQGQLTCDLNTITPAQGSLSGYCNLQGRLHALFYILQIDEGYSLILPKAILEHTLTVLKKYAMFSKVRFNDKSHEWVLAGMFDPNASSPYAVGSIDNTGITTLTVPKNRMILMGKADEIIKYCSSIKDMHYVPEDSWTWLDIQSGLPTLQEQTIETFLPHPLNLKQLGALNFEKGCYLGQEIIARMEFKSTQKRHLYLATSKSSSTPEPGAQVFCANESKQPTGQIVRAINFEDTLYCLCTLKDDAVASDLKVDDIPLNVTKQFHD